MISLEYILLEALAIILLLILGLSSIDFRKIRVLKTHPSVSFLIPCFNDGVTVKKTIRSINDSYDMSMSEIIVVDDKSTDSSRDALRELGKKYRFRLVMNKKNQGKAASLNRISMLAKHDILVFVDADVVMNNRALVDMFARLEQENVVAVSCPYSPENTGFLPSMQAIEYSMLSFLQTTHNIKSALSLWGGCIAIKKFAFDKVGKFSGNMISEDMDLGLKLNEAGYKVMQSFEQVKTRTDSSFRAWYRQKIRWTSGGVQCLIKHIWTWLKSPIHILFIFLISLLSILFLVKLLNELVSFNSLTNAYHLVTLGETGVRTVGQTAFHYSSIILRNLLNSLYLMAFSMPFIFPMLKKYRDIPKITYIVPFVLIYYPILSVVSTLGVIRGILIYRSLKENQRAW